MLCTDACFSKGLTPQEVDKLKILIIMMAFNTAIAFPISVFHQLSLHTKDLYLEELLTFFLQF